MQNPKPIQTALISVYYKDGLEPIVRALHQLQVKIISTGGTQTFIEGLGIPVTAVESITGYPSILDGRVKTLHPKLFGGILAKREAKHRAQLTEYDIPEIDLVIVDLYPFEETVATTNNETEIIEKIDVGGVALIRAAAKNFRDVLIVPSRADYPYLLEILEDEGNLSYEAQRRDFAFRAFALTSDYDNAIMQYLVTTGDDDGFDDDDDDQHTDDADDSTDDEATMEDFVNVLRYGENPHQEGVFYGDLREVFEKLNGKELSYNNLLDCDAAIRLIQDFKDEADGSDATFAVIKHTNACGVATRPTNVEAWKAALAADTTSAFGGILITNRPIDLATAKAMHEVFFEIALAPEFEPEALALLSQKKNRILLQLKDAELEDRQIRTVLNGLLEQQYDSNTEDEDDLDFVTRVAANEAQTADLIFANKCVKHLKSNGIALVLNQQLVGMGCGQTSRVDALENAIAKAKHFGLSLEGAVMASDAFFPFPDCVEIAHKAGIVAVVQPGGSLRDKDSIAYCNDHGIAMAMTGTRHFKH